MFLLADQPRVPLPVYLQSGDSAIMGKDSAAPQSSALRPISTRPEVYVSLADIRDIVIIVVGVLLVIQSLLFIVLIAVLIRLALALRQELRPLIEAATGTVRAVQGTSVVVGESIARPLIATSAFFVGVRRGVSVLSHALLKRKGAH